MNLHQRQRRQVLKTTGGLGLLGVLMAAGVISPREARAAWNKAAFEAKTLDDTLKALGATGAAENGAVKIIASDIAENGAVVPIRAVSELPNTESIAILVEKNPNMLAAHFDMTPETIADVSARIKMGQTSNVVVLVKADGKFHTATKEIKVTLGGCGG